MQLVDYVIILTGLVTSLCLYCMMCYVLVAYILFAYMCVLQKETPLANAAFWAARKGNLALLQLLLNSGRVDIDCKDSVRQFHLHSLLQPLTQHTLL